MVTDALDLMLPSAKVHQGETNVTLVMDFLEAELGAQTSSHSPRSPQGLENQCVCEEQRLGKGLFFRLVLLLEIVS